MANVILQNIINVFQWWACVMKQTWLNYCDSCSNELTFESWREPVCNGKVFQGNVPFIMEGEAFISQIFYNRSVNPCLCILCIFRVWHNPSVKVIYIWTGSYWIAYFLWGYNLCSWGYCVWLAVEPNWEHTHHLDTLSRWQQINSLIAHRWQIQFKQYITCWGMVLQLFAHVFKKIIANDKLRWIFFNNKKTCA